MPGEPIVRFSTSGLIFMLVSWAAIISLVAFCFTRLLRSGPKREDGEAVGWTGQINEEPND